MSGFCPPEEQDFVRASDHAAFPPTHDLLHTRVLTLSASVPSRTRRTMHRPTYLTPGAHGPFRCAPSGASSWCASFLCFSLQTSNSHHYSFYRRHRPTLPARASSPTSSPSSMRILSAIWYAHYPRAPFCTLNDLPLRSPSHQASTTRFLPCPMSSP